MRLKLLPLDRMLKSMMERKKMAELNRTFRAMRNILLHSKPLKRSACHRQLSMCQADYEKQRFANEATVNTLLAYLERFQSFEEADQIKRVVSLMHRQIVKVQAEGLYFKVTPDLPCCGALMLTIGNRLQRSICSVKFWTTPPLYRLEMPVEISSSSSSSLCESTSNG